MFARLRHEALIGGDDEQRRINAANARQHVLDETLVTWHVHDADDFATGQGKPCEPKVNRHLAFFFFFEAIRVNACQRFHERGLTMIYVPGRANYAQSLPPDVSSQ